MAKAELSLTIP